MKKLLPLIFALAFFTKTQAQVVFCPPGAEWNFSFHLALRPPTFALNEQIIYNGDSLLNNETVKKLKHERFFLFNNGNVNTHLTFIKQKGDTVFMKNARTLNQWQILYNFAATPGQGWYNTIEDGTPNLISHYTQIDSTDYITENNVALKRLFVTCYNNVGGIWRPGKAVQILERYGNTSFLFNYTNALMWSDDDYIWEFLCCRDNSFSLKQFSSRPCDYTGEEVGVNEHPFGENQLSIYPNPFQDKIYLDLELDPSEKIKIRILNTLGQELFTQDKTNNKEEVDLHFLQRGIYFIKVESGNKSKTVKLLKD